MAGVLALLIDEREQRPQAIARTPRTRSIRRSPAEPTSLSRYQTIDETPRVPHPLLDICACDRLRFCLAARKFSPTGPEPGLIRRISSIRLRRTDPPPV